ncbi:hypothetical protein [Psychrobacillus sp.]|uniref:hypothetical protein n=1 Tax=Psychrobacillus sp. TaxID=1871623 RepID=UPI0028BEE185|nr:hypothetical protein [Psychrobacillus sp.]
MLVKIRKSTEQSYWYADQVGEEFEVIEIRDDRQKGGWTVNDGEYDKCILKRDCEPA